MMHIKQHNSDDLCFSPTYSLLCSVSIPVERLWVKKSSRNQTGKHRFHMRLRPTQQPWGFNSTAAWKGVKHLRNTQNDTDTILFYVTATARPASGPLSCYGGCSSTQHPHAALWPPLSSRTSSENNFPPPAKLSASQSPLNTSKIPHKGLNYIIISLWNTVDCYCLLF